MAARPKLTGDEDELLRMQEDFVAGKLGPLSATIINKRPAVDENSENSQAPLKKKSIFAQRKETQKEETRKAPQTVEFTDVHILKDVIEKDVIFTNPDLPQPTINSFPAAFSIDKTLINNGKEKKKSLFAAHFKKSEESKTAENPSPTIIAEPANLWGASVLGQDEALKISQENELKLQNMKKEEILEEQEQLLKSVDPKLLDFLKSRNQQKNEVRIPSPAKNVTFKDLPSSVEELKSKKYLHMDVIEEEKFEWMAPPPPLKTVKGNFNARFDFEGHLLPYDVDLPPTSALYHHGEEPERAGYTLNELLTLSRSTVTQQRVIALNTLAKIMENYHLGFYDDCFEKPFLENLLEAGLLFALRYAIDDGSEVVASAGLSAFCRLIAADFDEVCLDRVLLWYRGEEQPRLRCSESKTENGREENEEEEEMKDHELVQIDVIKTCLRIDVLPRLRYILEVLKPPAPAVLASLGILTRIAHHSEESAKAIVDTPRLVQTLVENFLPLDWTLFLVSDNKISELSNVYGIPLRQVLRLLRILAAWNKSIAETLATKYAVLKSIVCYVAMDTTSLRLPSQEALRLSLESYNTWRTFVHQGFGLEELVDLFPAFMRQLMFLQSEVSMDSGENMDSSKFSHQLGAALFLLLEKSCQKLGLVPIQGLLGPASNCLKKWTWELSQLSSFSDSSMNLLAAAIHFICTSGEAAKILEDFATVLNHALEPLLKILWALVPTFSNFGAEAEPVRRNTPSLPSLDAALRGGVSPPIVTPCSPFPLLTALFRLINVWSRHNPDDCKKIVSTLLIGQNIEDYLQRLANSEIKLKGNWFTRYEVHFFRGFVTCAANCSSVNLANLHEATQNVITAVSNGDEVVITELMENVIFNEKCIRNKQDLDLALQNLRISTAAYEDLLTKALANLHQISSFYIKSLFGSEPQRRTNLTMESFGQTLLPSDWLYLPLMAVYQQHNSPGNENKEGFNEEVSLTLQWVYIMMLLQRNWFRKLITPAAHYCRLACVFLSGSDLFLNLDVANHMWPILRGLCGFDQWDFTTAISGVDDFHSFLKQIVDHFESVSYGNTLFGAFLMIPLQQRFDVKYRLLLWGEHPDALRSMVLSEQHLLLPLDNWLSPPETNELLIAKYYAAIKHGHVIESRNPVLWRIAVVHLKQFAAANPSKEISKNISNLQATQ